MPKKLNADQKRARRAGELAVFLQQYARKAQKNWDPNDRRYDREVEKRISQVSAEALNEMMRDDEAG